MKSGIFNTLALAAALSLGTATGALAQQIKMPAPSPAQTVKQAFGLGEITIDYSRPLARGRVIFGDLVPYGEVWRTGANATTKITFTDEVRFGGYAVKPGTYGLYTIPGRNSWQVMLYKDLSLGGNVAHYDKANEVLRITVEPKANGHMVESFTINLDNVAANTATLQLMWERTIVPIKITTNIDSRIMENIASVMKVEDSRPYFQAANYYYQNDKDMNQALTWVNKAIEQNNAFYVVHLKAKIQMKLKDYSGAIETAKESMSLARVAQSEDYIHLNEKLIAKATKAMQKR